MDIAAVESTITGAFLLLMLALIIAGISSTFKAIALGESSRDLFAYFGIAGLLGAVMAVHRALPRLIESLAAEASPTHPVILIGIGVVVVVPVVGLWPVPAGAAPMSACEGGSGRTCPPRRLVRRR